MGRAAAVLEEKPPRRRVHLVGGLVEEACPGPGRGRRPLGRRGPGRLGQLLRRPLGHAHAAEVRHQMHALLEGPREDLAGLLREQGEVPRRPAEQRAEVRGRLRRRRAHEGRPGSSPPRCTAGASSAGLAGT
eukprot:4747878-Lingulodinium_polyedra.AAC.1